MIDKKAYTVVISMLVIAAVAYFSAFKDAFAQGDELVQMHQEMLYPSVRIKVSGGGASGTVVYSSEYEGQQHTYVLTNFHVISSNIKVGDEWSPQEQKQVKVERRSPVMVEWFDYNDLSREVGTRGKTADIVAYNENLDLALLRIRDKEATIKHIAKLAPENRVLHLFEAAWAVGSGLGQPPFPTQGMISNLDQQINGNRYIFSSAPIIFGNSGGSLYHYEESNQSYEMIGVPAMGAVIRLGWGGSTVEHMAWAIPMETVYKFLRDNRFHFIWGEVVPDED